MESELVMKRGRSRGGKVSPNRRANRFELRCLEGIRTKADMTQRIGTKLFVSS